MQSVILLLGAFIFAADQFATLYYVIDANANNVTLFGIDSATVVGIEMMLDC